MRVLTSTLFRLAPAPAWDPSWCFIVLPEKPRDRKQVVRSVAEKRRRDPTSVQLVTAAIASEKKLAERMGGGLQEASDTNYLLILYVKLRKPLEG